MVIKVKELVIKPIKSEVANNFVRKHHYSGKVVNNSVLHFGVFYSNFLMGVLSFGSPIDKRNILSLVETENKTTNEKWNEMLELNRMAFDEKLPKNSESRAIGVCMRIIKKNYPEKKWILSFADGTQCGDGTIYRASGFKLTAIKKNSIIYELKSGKIMAKHGTSKKDFTGAKALKGFQLRYIYLIDKKARITTSIIPFSMIDEVGAGMYKSKKIKVKERRVKHSSDAVRNQRTEGSAILTDTLQ